MSLGQLAVKSMIWNSLGSYIRFAFSFIGQLVLVRLLMPEDFGIFAFAIAILEVFSFIIGWNFSLGIIQMPEDHELTDTAYWLTLVQSVIYVIVLSLVSLLLISFSKSQVAIVLFLLAVSYSFGPVSQIFVAGIQKKLLFKNYSIANTVSGIISIIIAVVLAMLGFGVWSLVFREIIYAVFSLILFIVISDWRFGWRFNKLHAKNLLVFGSKIFLSRWFEGLSARIDTLIGGLLLSSGKLGFYSQGRYLINLPTTALTPVMSNALFSVYSKVQKSDEKLVEVNKYMNYFLLRLVVPISFLFFLFSGEIVSVLFGDKWIASASIMKWLAFYPLLFVLFENQKLLLQGKGELEKPIWALVFQVLTAIILIVFGYKCFGFQGIALGYVLSFLLCCIFTYYYSWQYVFYSANEFILPFFISALLAVVVFVLKCSIFSCINHLILIFVFIVLYLLLLCLFERKILAERVKYLLDKVTENKS